MGIIQKIKYSIIKGQINKTKNAHPFDQVHAELYEIDPADRNHPNNSYYFSFHNMEGKSVLFRLAQRGDRNELWFVYHDSNGKTYYNKDMFTNERSTAEVDCLEVGLKWQFRFSGELVERHKENSEPPIFATFEGEFNATAPIFEFSRHMAPEPVAQALSREKWTKDFRKSITENHQVHYEQPGTVTGNLILNGEEIALNMQAMRDHSFGKREWNYMDRHIWLTALLETGEILNVNMVRYPALFELQTGYFEKKGSYICVNSATPMDDLSLSGNVPEHLTCKITLMNGNELTMECERETEIPFSFDNGDYTIFEGIGKFTVNGVKGRGIMEFGYNKDKNRWTR